MTIYISLSIHQYFVVLILHRVKRNLRSISGDLRHKTGPCASSSQGIQTHTHTHTFPCYRQFRDVYQPTIHIFGLREETEVLSTYMQTPHTGRRRESRSTLPKLIHSFIHLLVHLNHLWNTFLLQVLTNNNFYLMFFYVFMLVHDFTEGIVASSHLRGLWFNAALRLLSVGNFL